MADTSVETEIAQTWKKLELGVDRVMNKLEEGLSYEKYMELYTYFLRTNTVEYITFVPTIACNLLSLAVKTYLLKVKALLKLR